MPFSFCNQSSGHKRGESQDPKVIKLQQKKAPCQPPISSKCWWGLQLSRKIHYTQWLFRVQRVWAANVMMSLYSALKLAVMNGYLVAMQSWIGVSQTMPHVDLELVMAVDTSGSMDRTKLALQRQGYINAFRHKDFARAIKSGPLGKIAIVYMEWAGPHYQNVLVPWTVIDSVQDANQFADNLAAQPLNQPPPANRGTSISEGLLFAATLLQQLGNRSGRAVIDISGDGANNTGPPVSLVRDMLVAHGITINGLPIILQDNHDFNYWAPDPAQLQSYFEDCVTGGPNSFVFVVGNMAEFEKILHRKLMQEIITQPTLAGLNDSGILKGDDTDCLATGEHSVQ